MDRGDMYQVQCPDCGEVTKASFVRIGAVVDCASCRCRYRLSSQNVHSSVSGQDNSVSKGELGVVASVAGDSQSKENSGLDASWAGLIPSNIKPGDTAVLAALPPNAINKTPPKATIRHKRTSGRNGTVSAVAASQSTSARQRPEKPPVPASVSSAAVDGSPTLAFPSHWIGRLASRWLKVGIIIVVAALLATAAWIKWQRVSPDEKQSIYVQADTGDHP